MGVSRVTVVKYLQTARENGLVHINLDVNVFGSIDAALQIRDKFNLQRVIIVSDGERGYDATLGALLGGYVTDLIVDEGTAEFLLACELPH